VDGGLYVPTHFPDLSGELAKLRNLSFTDLAHAILTHFFHSSVIPSNDLKALIDKSFAKFESNEVTPLRELGDDMWVLELYKGPTLSFKDVALQFLGNFLDYLVGKNNASKPLVVLGATSGDTGSAAIAGLEGKKGIKIVILYPDGRVSPIQEMQMIADQSENVTCLACPGTFDDCQVPLPCYLTIIGVSEEGLCRRVCC
jgi:threonine synthase